MAGTTNDLFLFGDDFEAILSLSENDEAIKEHFSATVGNVSTMSLKFDLSRLERSKKATRL